MLPWIAGFIATNHAQNAIGMQHETTQPLGGQNSQRQTQINRQGAQNRDHNG